MMAYTIYNIFEKMREKTMQHNCNGVMICHMNATKRLAALLMVGIICVCNLAAFQFSPLEQTFAPSGAESTKTYTIVNDSDDSIAIEISVETRDQDEFGNELNSDASAYFSIVPAKVIVKPQSTQIVRVQYRGPRTVTNELSFRLRATQIEYSQGKNAQNKGMFNFMYVYSTSLYVNPSKPIARAGVHRVAPVVAEDGTRYMAVTISNTGNVHQLLLDASLEVSDSAGNAVTLKGNEALPGIDGMNILAKRVVTKNIPWPDALAVGEGVGYKASMTYSK
jgi:fimbrial chaperone protein